MLNAAQFHRLQLACFLLTCGASDRREGAPKQGSLWHAMDGHLMNTLHDWQDLAGAIIGGLLGVIGALIVADSARNRERRNASRMLQRDLLNVTGMVHGLTYQRKVTLATLDPDRLVADVSFYRHSLSPLFEAQMAIIIGTDTGLAGLLIGFQKAYSVVESHLRQIERARTEVSPLTERARKGLPRMLQSADDYAQAALYLLPLQELGTFRRVYERLRRRFFPTPEDTTAQELVSRKLGVRAELEDKPADDAE
jgi:hypothetical protein